MALRKDSSSEFDTSAFFSFEVTHFCTFYSIAELVQASPSRRCASKKGFGAGTVGASQARHEILARSFVVRFANLGLSYEPPQVEKSLLTLTEHPNALPLLVVLSRLASTQDLGIFFNSIPARSNSVMD